MRKLSGCLSNLFLLGVNNIIKRHSIQKDDCMSCCIASILHLDPCQVPKFILKTRLFYKEINDWLSFNFNLKTNIYLDNDIKKAFDNRFYIGSLKTSCGRRHAVVCKNNLIIHDPSEFTNNNKYNFNNIDYAITLIDKKYRAINCLRNRKYINYMAWGAMDNSWDFNFQFA